MPAPEQPALIAGRLLLCEEFAAGGMASIHFGRQLGAAGFLRTVAIKRLHPHLARDPELVAMFVDEAMLAARIRHRNVVATLDVVQHEEELLLVMEYVDGEPLSALVKAARCRGERLPPAVVSRIVCDALAGLHAAHEAQSDSGAPLDIVHRDVSPSNLLVGADGVARVLDFGIAKASVRVSSTREGGLKGKLRYMAPEQVADGEVGRRTDVYAAAVVLWELLVGEPLFRASNEAALMARITEGVVVAPSRRNASLLPALDEVVLRALAREPGARFESAHAFALALEAALPPATSRRVAEWVMAIAAESLAARRQALARVESMVRWPDAAAGGTVQGMAIVTETDTEGPTQLVAAKTSPRAAHGRASWLLGAVVLLGAGAAVALLGARQLGDGASTPADVAESGAPTAAARASSRAATSAGASSPTSQLEPDDGAADRSIDWATAGPASSTAADDASSRPAPQPGVRAPSARRTSTPSCDPPYVVDASGRRQVKRECL